MHDPLTVAFTIRNPFLRAHVHSDGWKWRPPLLTIWHRDPEKGEGGDDSCDWSGRRRPLDKRERALLEALDELFHTLGNPPYYPNDVLWGDLTDGDEHPLRHGLAPKAQRAMYAWLRRGRFRWHPRWHFHHWRFQIHPVQHFKRWAFSRCHHCNGRFKWGYAPVSNGWGGRGPRWFRNAEDSYHADCHSLAFPATYAKAVPAEEGKSA